MLRNRWLRRVGITLIVLFVLGVTGFFYVRGKVRERGVERLAAVTAETDAAEPGWRLDDLDAARGSMPDRENSALLVPQFKAAVAGSDVNFRRTDPSGMLVDVSVNRRLDDEAAGAIDKALEGSDAALAIARSFKDRPRGLRRYQITPDVIGTLLPDVQESRQIATMLDFEAERLAADGRHGAALQLVPAMLNVGRSMDGEPFLISALVRIAIDSIAARRAERSLALGAPAGGLAEVQAALLKEAEGDVFATPIRGERACLDRLFTNIRNGTVPATAVFALAELSIGSGHPNPERDLAAWAYRPFLTNDHAVCLETMNEYCAVVKLPEHQQRTVLRAVPLPQRTRGSILTSLLLPAISKMHDASLRHKAALRCAAVGLAVERFRQKYGRWPEILAEIPPTILSALPPDPFDGQPLRYARRPDGVTIYSIGLDEADDGGNVPEQWGAQQVPGTDVGFRLFDLESRGLPPVARSKTAGIRTLVVPQLGPATPSVSPGAQLPRPRQLPD
jgi:hypothetical protein